LVRFSKYGKIIVIVGKILNDERNTSFPKMTICALKFSSSARERVLGNGGKIITFAKTAIGNDDPNYPCPPFKLVILDEADAMTTEAQSALRKVMEELSELTRFCFICNFINQIIDPIASRCMKFRFKPITSKNMVEKLQYICSKENFPANKDILETISFVSKGDARKAIMTLQNLKYVYDYKKSVEIDDVLSITGHIPKTEITPLIENALDNKSSISSIIDKVNNFKRNGYPIISVLDFIRNYISNYKKNKLDDKQKSMIMIQIGMAEKRLMDGSDEFLQLLSLFSYIHGVITNDVDFVSSCMC
jgi:replication factor C subunit 2/4